MSQPFIDLRAVSEARYQSDRQTFLRRHQRASVPWLMFVIGYFVGIAVMLLAR